MSSLFSIDIAQLKIYAKNGLTPEDVQLRFNCSEDELLNRLVHLYKGNDKKARGLYSQFETNRKKSHKKKETVDLAVGDQIPTVDSDTTPVEEQMPIEGSEILIDNQAPTLEELLEKEKNLSAELMKLENEYWGILHERHLRRIKLQELSSEVEEIRQKLKNLQTTINSVVEEANDLGEQANEISLILRPKKVALEELRHEIEQKKTVSLFVYKDGRIEAPDNSDFIIDDEGYLDLKSELSEREECLDLRLRDITTLARLLKISERNEHLALIFEDETLEIVYMTIKGA